LLGSGAISKAANEQHAVVRIPSHGASATVIETGVGYTWILGCGHAYHGDGRNKPMIFDIPTIHPGQHKRVGSKLIKLDYEMDLSLVLLNDGPLAFVCPIAWEGWHEWHHNTLSIGYDEMQTPAKMKPAHIVEEQGSDYFTRERPWHGRSGGALIDMDSGRLVGVVQGYMTDGPRYGMYVSLATIRQFIYGDDRQVSRQQPRQLQPFWHPYQQFSPGCPAGG
jgi:hypothetical protein